jgi:hypothetical protein
MMLYCNDVFAALDYDHVVERIAGGNETEVYRSDDGRFVLKRKGDLAVNDLAHALAECKTMRHAAEEYIRCLGPDYTIPSEYLIARNSDGALEVIVLQPFLRDAQPLYHLEYERMEPRQRERIASQLQDIIERSLAFYAKTGSMPDLYGRTSSDPEERKRLNKPWMLPWRLWSFIVQRNLLRAHNLMWLPSEERIVLVDYDYVRRSELYRKLYYAVRRVLFWRDRLLMRFMLRGYRVPGRS